jgi:hypothetical protein
MKEISATILLAVFLFGCSEPLTTREKGAAIGTVFGAGLGAIIGSATGNAGAGTGPSSSGIVRLLGRANFNSRPPRRLHRTYLYFAS